jgi:small redox-active disulfide protein 2
MRKIYVLGGGCARCRQLADNTAKAIETLGTADQLVRVTDIEEILKFGILVLPALVVDGQVKVVGRVPSHDEIVKLLSQ